MSYEDQPHPDVLPYDYLPRGATAEEYDRISRRAYERAGSRAPSWWVDVYLMARHAIAALRDGGRYGRPHDPLVGEPLPIGDPDCGCGKCEAARHGAA